MQTYEADVIDLTNNGNNLPDLDSCCKKIMSSKQIIARLLQAVVPEYLDSEADLMNFAKADAYGIAQYFGIETGGEEYEEVPKPAGEWKKINGKWYYYIGNEKQTGWIDIP